MSISYKAIGRNIRNARCACGLTQEQIAESLHMSTLHFGRLERGQRRVSLDQLTQISNLLETSLSTLLFGADCSNTPLCTSRLSASIDYLSSGCSSSAINLMLDLCRLIAEHDKLHSK